MTGLRVGVVTFPGSLDDVDAQRAARVVGLAVDLDLEPLALADVADAFEPEPREGTEDGLALGVEDLALGHHVDDVAGHGGAFRGRYGNERTTPV